MYAVTPKDNDINLNYENMFEQITNNVELDPLDKKKVPATKLIGTYRVPDRSAPTTSVDVTFELIDTSAGNWSRCHAQKWFFFSPRDTLARNVAFEILTTERGHGPIMVLKITRVKRNGESSLINS